MPRAGVTPWLVDIRDKNLARSNLISDDGSKPMDSRPGPDMSVGVEDPSAISFEEPP